MDDYIGTYCTKCAQLQTNDFIGKPCRYCGGCVFANVRPRPQFVESDVRFLKALHIPVEKSP
jgi:hypothetical protein